MPIDLQFVGADSFPLLYSGQPFRTLVKLPMEGATVHESEIVPRVEVFESRFCFGFAKPDEIGHMRGGITTGGNLLAAFRCALLLQEVPIIGSDSMNDVVDCVVRHKDGDARRRAGRMFDDIMGRVPPEMARALLLAGDASVELDADAYLPLVDAGTLTLDDELRFYGLESTTERTARQDREVAAVAPYKAVITAFKASKHEMVAEAFGDFLQGYLLEVLRRGIVDPVIVAAWSVFKTESRFLQMSGSTVDGLLLTFKGSKTEVQMDPAGMYRQRLAGLRKGAELSKLVRTAGDTRSEAEIIGRVEALERRFHRLATGTI